MRFSPENRGVRVPANMTGRFGTVACEAPLAARARSRQCYELTRR